MSTNGHATNGDSYHALREQLKTERARTELARLKAQRSILEAYPQHQGYRDWPTPFGDFTDQSGRVWIPFGSRNDRVGGADRPFIWTEIDLRWMRSRARWLTQRNGLAAGILRRLRNFTVKRGFAYEVQADEDHKLESLAQALVPLVQAVIDDFHDLNRWSMREKEFFVHSRRDGDALLRHFGQVDGTTLVRPIMSEQLEHPPDAEPHTYPFGIEHTPGDVEDVQSYAVCYQDPHWEEVPAEDVCHMKVNVDSCVLRGISDFYAGGELLDGTHTMLQNMVITGGAQSAIAWIEQVENATQASLDALIGASKNLNLPPAYTDPFTGRDVKAQTIIPGEKIVVGGGRTYQGAPLAQNTTQHTAIVQAALRAIGCRWDMPEYMVSGDAGANLASSLISGSPFVNMIECEQDDYIWYFLRSHWIAVRNAAHAGRFVVGGRVITFEEVMNLVDIHVTPPQVAIADMARQAEIDHKDIAAGVLSKQHRRQKLGVDNDKIKAELQEEPVDKGGQGGPPAPQDAGPVGQAGLGGMAEAIRESLARHDPAPVITQPTVNVTVPAGEAPSVEIDQRSPSQSVPIAERYERDEDGNIVRKVYEYAEPLIEGCVPNKSGGGHHDEDTGHACSPSSSELEAGRKQRRAEKSAEKKQQAAAAAEAEANKPKTIVAKLAAGAKAIASLPAAAQAKANEMYVRATAAVDAAVEKVVPAGLSDEAKEVVHETITDAVVGAVFGGTLSDVTAPSPGALHTLGATVAAKVVLAIKNKVMGKVAESIIMEQKGLESVDPEAVADAVESIIQALVKETGIDPGQIDMVAVRQKVIAKLAKHVKESRLAEGVEQNKSGHGCHDTETGHPAKCPGGDDAKSGDKPEAKPAAQPGNASHIPATGKIDPHAIKPRKFAGNAPNPTVPNQSRPPLAESEHMALQVYSTNDYKRMNKAIRETGQPPDTHAEVHAEMQKAFAKAEPFSEPVQVTRGLDLPPDQVAAFLGPILAAQKSGQPVQFDGYVSTASDPSAAFAGNVEMRIAATHGIDMDPVSVYPGERELLLNHGSQFRVKSVMKGKNGKYIIELEQIPPEKGKPAPPTLADASAIPGSKQARQASAEELKAVPNQPGILSKLLGKLFGKGKK